MKQLLKIALIAFIGLTASYSYGQKSVVAAGGNAVGTSGTASFSIGQISYKSPEGTIVSNGVQQPYEIQVLSTNEYAVQLEMVVYPNPTSDYLNLKIADESLTNLTYQLYDINGKTLVKEEKINGAETSVPMQNLSKGVYFLNVTMEGKPIKSFKILKK